MLLLAAVAHVDSVWPNVPVESGCGVSQRFSAHAACLRWIVAQSPSTSPPMCTPTYTNRTDCTGLLHGAGSALGVALGASFGDRRKSFAKSLAPVRRSHRRGNKSKKNNKRKHLDVGGRVWRGAEGCRVAPTDKKKRFLRKKNQITNITKPHATNK